MLVPLVAMLLQAPLRDRPSFQRAMGRVQDGMSEAQVRRLLGEPDDVWTAQDSSLYAGAGTTVWCYGSEGHLSFPTLGRVAFQDGKAAFWGAGEKEKAIRGLPSEAALVRHLRAIAIVPSRSREFDPLWTIRAANDLRPLGKEGALAVMLQYSRLAGSFDWSPLYWLAFCLFDPNGAFTLPGIGVFSPGPPKNPASWPTFPFLVVEDVPFSFFRGFSLLGLPEAFEDYIERESKTWTLRQHNLRPPDDPFPSFKKAVQTFQSEHSDVELEDTYQPFGSQFQSLLTLVDEVYPTEKGGYLQPSMDSYDEHHANFLRSGGHWDQARQRYVRGDGSLTPRYEDRYPQFGDKIVGIPGLMMEVTVERMGPREVQFSVSSSLEGERHLAGKIGVIDLATGKYVGYDGMHDAALESVGLYWNWWAPPWQRVRFELTVDGKTYRSRVFTV